MGKDGSRFEEQKRSVPSNDIGPLVATEMSRCIHCTRCVRFGEEVAGVMEMGAPGRGENVKISTFLNRSIDSEVSGNIIDLCPVGALTSKPFRFSARSWELRDHNSISPHDCLGTNIISRRCVMKWKGFCPSRTRTSMNVGSPIGIDLATKRLIVNIG